MVGFPLLLIPLAVYNIIVFLMPGVSFTDPVVKLTLMSGAEWQVTLSDILLALGILLLLFEVIKGARPGAKFLTDHLLSLIVFGAAAAEFLLWPKFGNSTYCLLALLALVDFLSGVALRSTPRRRGGAGGSCPGFPTKRETSAGRGAGGRTAHRSGARPGTCSTSSVTGAWSRRSRRIRAARSSRTDTRATCRAVAGIAAGWQPAPGYAPALILLR